MKTPDQMGPGVPEKPKQKDYKKEYEKAVKRYKRALSAHNKWIKENSSDYHPPQGKEQKSSFTILPEKEKEYKKRDAEIKGMAAAFNFTHEHEEEQKSSIPETPEQENYKKIYEEGIERFKKALLGYKDWLKENQGQYIPPIEKGDKGFYTLRPEKEQEERERNVYLDSMAVTLNLTYKEQIKIMDEIGFTGSLQAEEQK